MCAFLWLTPLEHPIHISPAQSLCALSSHYCLGSLPCY